MDFDKYVNQMPYLRSSDLSRMRSSMLHAYDDIPMTTTERAEKENEINEQAAAEYKRSHAAYEAESARLHALFYTDAHEELGIAYLPKPVLEKLDMMAWSRGHSAGYHEVWNAMQDLVELAELAYEQGKKAGEIEITTS